MNKIAFITGASSGIGEACAHILAAHKYDLILNARRADKLKELANTLQDQYEIQTQLIPFDVRNKGDVHREIHHLPEKWRHIDVLINNAGLAKGLSHFFEGNSEDWDTMIDTNVKGLMYVSREIAPWMIENKSGHIVNIGSIAGKEIYDKGNVYVGTKHAVDAISKSMRLELSSHNVRVTAIHPGAVETEFSLVRFNGDAERAKTVYQGFDNLVATDIADAVYWAISRPAHVNINELTIMPTAQPMAGVIHRKS
ncbi:MAG: SDR family NAD(P)-dependent oxidoreductase [Bacteroidetes bacterium]|nr:SDR family NAD(P)-dependent oxidoreductase [Bacteroidota bacterium]